MNRSAWYVVRVRPRKDKKATHYFEKAGIECYLPLQRKLHQSSERKMWVEVPELSPYLFVKINPKEHNSIFESTSIMNYVRYNKDYTTVTNSAMNGQSPHCRPPNTLET